MKAETQEMLSTLLLSDLPETSELDEVMGRTKTNELLKEKMR